MFTGWLSLGGVEIVNHSRTKAYVRSGCGPAMQFRPRCDCDTLPAALGDAPYTTPASDPAPWYDPAEPHSADFVGLWVEQIDGLYDSPVSRDTTERIFDGAIPGPARARGRVLTVRGWLMTRTCCAGGYAIRWLAAALTGSTCSGLACNTDDRLCLFQCCPTSCPDGEGEGEGEGPSDPCAERELRSLYGAVLISGPTLLRSGGGSCGCGTCPMQQVEFQLLTDPYLYREPVTVLDGGTWPPPDPNAECDIVWVPAAQCDPANPGCPRVNPQVCFEDPDCPLPPRPPPLPVVTDQCVCNPFFPVTQAIEVPAGLVPDWLDAVLVIEAYAGSAPLRQVRITVWANPLDLPVDELDVCGACADFHITYVPDASVMILDGIRSTATMVCPGDVRVDASRVVFGQAGGPFTYPVLTCGSAVAVRATAGQAAPDATLTVRLVTRET